jgi:hypothetical protein
MRLWGNTLLLYYSVYRLYLLLSLPYFVLAVLGIRIL